MKKNKKNKTLLTVLILLLAITIGYAAIATTLKINGSADVKSARWNVYWDENSIQVTSGSVETSEGNEARVTDTGKTQIEYSVELSEPGDFYEFTVDAVNEGSLNAKIAPNGVKNNIYESDGTTPKNLPNYIGYTVKYAENDADVTAGDVLEAKKGNTPTRKKYKVRVWYKTDIDPSTLNESTTETMKLVFEVDYVQGEKSQPDPYLTKFDGNYKYQWGDVSSEGYTEDGNGWYTSLNPNSKAYLRDDGTIIETCGVLENGTVCMTSPSYLDEYSSAGNFDADFEDCNEDEDYDGTGNTCLKGYVKSKVNELISKGVSSCSIYDYGEIYCYDNNHNAIADIDNYQGGWVRFSTTWIYVGFDGSYGYYD